MSARIEFGVGCFAFEWGEEIGERSAKDWSDDVTEALSSLANVSAIDVSVDRYFLRNEGLGQDFGESYAYPHPSHAAIRFDITIPRRHHKHTYRGMRASENYRVFIDYFYESPVAFIVPLDEGIDPGSASTGVMLVREHLKEHLSDASEVKFSFMGPSPFHADFVLVDGAGEGLDETFECDLVPSRGYDDIAFRYDPASFKDADEAFDGLRDEIGHELSAYYFLVRSGNRRSRVAREVAQQAQVLVALHTETGPRSKWRRLFHSGGQARQLALAVMDAELETSWSLQFAEQLVQSLYKGGSGFLRTYVDSVPTPVLSPLVVNARNVVQQLESGRTKELEVTLITSATLGGALAGGLISGVVTLVSSGKG